MPKPLMQTTPTKGLGFKIFAVYGKPLLNEKRQPLLDPTSLGADIQRALSMLNISLLKRLRKSIMDTTYSQAARRKLAASVQMVIRKSSLVLTVTSPIFRPLIMGQKSQQMAWLARATKPIPIVLDNGEVIFRKATARSLAGGGWVHPGRKSTGIVEKVQEEARAAIKKRIAADIRRRLREASK